MNNFSTLDEAVGARLRRAVFSELRYASGPLMAEDLCEALASNVTDEIQAILDSAVRRGRVCFQGGGYCLSPMPDDQKAKHRRRPFLNVREARPEVSQKSAEALVSEGPVSFRGLRFANRAELALFLAYLSFLQSEICLIVECDSKQFWELITVARAKEPWGPSISAGWRYASEHPVWSASSESLVVWAASLKKKERLVMCRALQRTPLSRVSHSLGVEPDMVIDIAGRSAFRCPQRLLVDNFALSQGVLSCCAPGGD